MTLAAVAHHRTALRLGPVGRVVFPFYLMGSLIGWTTGGVGMLFPAFGSAVWLMALWYGLRQSSGIRLRALPCPPHWSGQPFLFDLELSTEHRRTLRDLTLCLRADSKGRAIRERPVAFLNLLAAGQSEIIPCGHRHLTRGPQRNLSLSLYSAFPLALLQLERHFELPVDLLAWPRLGLWRGQKPPIAQQGNAQQQQARRRGHEEFYQLNPWRPGMPQRNIHWKLSARRGRLLQQEMESASEAALTVGLLLAEVEQRSQRIGTRESFETAVALTATLVDHHLRAGRVIELALYGGESLKNLRGRAGRSVAMNALAQVQAEALTPAELDVRFQAAKRHSPSQLVVAIPPSSSALPQLGSTPVQGATPTQVLNVESPTIDTQFRRAQDSSVNVANPRQRRGRKVRS